MADYVVNGAKLRCVMGLMSDELVTTTGHGVLFGGEPIMNANDHIKGVNIGDFGICAAKTLLANGVPQKCEPMTMLPWILVNMKALIDGAPALTTNSKLPCMCGGVISIVPPPPSVPSAPKKASKAKPKSSKSSETNKSSKSANETPASSDAPVNEVEQFEQNIKTQFNLDDKTAGLMGDVYTKLKEKNPQDSQQQTDWKFTRLIGGLTYNSYAWDQTAGVALDGCSEQAYFENKLDMNTADYNYLKYKVRVQNAIVGADKKQYYDDILKDKLPSYKANYEKGYGIKLEDVEFKELWNSQLDKLHGKGDMSHQFITTSTMLATDLSEHGMWADVYFLGDDGKRENMAGWLGDATILAGDNLPSLGADDYISDLDAENIVHSMKENNLGFINATNDYYKKLENGSNRADIFLNHTSLDGVKNDIFEEFSLNSNLYFYPLPICLPSEDKKREMLKELSPDAHTFIENLESKNQTMTTIKTPDKKQKL